MCNFGFNGHIPWLPDTNGANSYVCKHTVENTSHFVIGCPSFKVCSSDPIDGYLMVNFVDDVDKHSDMLLLLGGLPLPFDQMTAHSMRRLSLRRLKNLQHFYRKATGDGGLCGYLTKMPVSLRRQLCEFTQ